MNEEEPTIVGDGAPPSEGAGTRDPSLKRGTTLGRYVLLEAIGAGAMGIVYTAYDPRLDRRVAIKLVRPTTDLDSVGHNRILFEAQALAKLTHPNVVTVHDVGSIGDDEVFVAMEFIQGQTLKQWLSAQVRTTADVIAVYRKAGAGLQAAHEAGLVHRDFKPENVMVAEDGRVLVMDFGLARTTGPTESEITQSGVGERRHDLTATGAIMGTPAYMAPEQFSGRDATPASDQFSFCVALYEGLAGERPFAGDSLASLMLAVRNHELRPLPATVRLPARVLAAVVRGLEVDPARRHASVRDLLDALGPAAGQRHQGTLWMGAGVVVASSIAAVSFAHPSAERMCQTGGARIEGQWSPQRAADLAMAWEATAVPHASESFAITRARLDAYADAWTHEYIEACEATHVRGAQSERRLDLRMDCMQQRLDHFGALIDELEQVDDDVLSRSVTAVGALPEVEHCRDPQIHEQVTLDPATRKRVRAVEQHLAQARAKESAGRYAAGLQVATSALEDLGDLEAPHLRARLLLRQGMLQSRQGDAERGASILRDALRTASLTADRRLVAQVWIDLLFLVGSTLEQTEQAEGLALGSEAAVLAAGNPDDLRGAYLHKLATLEATAGRVEDALAHHEQSITLTEQSGADPLVLATRHANYGNALIDAGRYADARLQHRRAFDLSSSVYGQEHPILAQDLNNLARASQKLGEYDDALDAFTRALAIAERTLGTEHSDYADALYNLAVFHYDRQEFDRARTMGERALAVWTRAWGEDHPRIAAAHVHLGNIDQALGRLDDALLHAKRAYAIYRARFGDDYPLLRVPLNNIANNHYEQGRYSEALEGFHEAIALTERTLGPDHPSLAFPLTGAAKSLLKMDRPAAAVDPGERALALRELKQPEPILIGISAFVAARARWDAHDDRERAVELARQAHRAWTESEGGERDERRHEVETWLRKRGLATTEDVPRGANPG